MMHPIRRLRALALAALALVATTLAPSLAAATSVVRIEWLQIANGAPGTPSTFYGEQRLSVTGSTPVSSSAAPTFPPGAGVARVTVISGAVVAAWGASPTSSESGGIRLEQGDEKDIVLSSGQFLSFVEALDPASGQAVTVTGGATYPPDAAGNGTLNSATLNAAINVTLANGEGTAAFSVSGLTATTTGVLTPEVSEDGGNTWWPTTAYQIGDGDGATLTADGDYLINTGAHGLVRLRVSTTGTGTITIAWRASTIASHVFLGGALPGFETPPTVNIGSGGPSNYALETGGVLANIYSRLGTLDTDVKAPIAAQSAGGVDIGAVELAPGKTTGTTHAATVGTASAQMIASASARTLLVIDNESTTASVACNLGGTAALNTAGSWTIPPGQTRTWNSYPVPPDVVNCIASAASTPVTYEVF